MMVSVLGLTQFPFGTLLFGWSLFTLWKARSQFYPFNKRQTKEESKTDFKFDHKT